MPVVHKHRKNRYIAPTDKYGDEYFVPIVTKNKDTLVAFQLGALSSMDIIGYQLPFNLITFLGPDRFIDLSPENIRLNTLDEDELKVYLVDVIMKGIERSNNDHIDNDVDLSEYLLTVSCTCGNFFGFLDVIDVPETDLHCDICNKKVIEYIHVDDHEIIDEAVDPEVYNDIIEEIKSEMGEDPIE